MKMIVIIMGPIPTRVGRRIQRRRKRFDIRGLGSDGEEMSKEGERTLLC